MLTATLVIQIYAVFRIAYRKWKHRSNEVVIFVVPDSIRNSSANTRSYNEVLYDLAPMVFLGIVIIVCGSVRIIYMAMGLPENYRNVHPMFLYYYEFSELFIMQIGFPLIFYFFHPKARTYVCNAICCK